MKNNQQLTVEQIKNIEQQFQANDNNNGNHFITSLTCLPDELWLLVLSYLNIVDIFHSFHGLNQRFNNIINDCIRRITLPEDVTNAWFNQYMPQLESKITTICLDEKFLQYVFNNQWSFLNLQLINLQGSGWNLSLRVGKKPLLIILMSLSKFLQNIGISINPFSTDTTNFNIDDEDNYWKTLLCPYIERLSMNTCSVKHLFIICNHLPNLVYLKIDYLKLDGHHHVHLNGSDSNKRTARLVTLNITTGEYIYFYILEELIKSCKISLKNLTLNVCSSKPIDGYQLEELFKSCEKLENFIFSLTLKNKNININNYQRSFQSKWWLNTRRPPVYIQQTDDDNANIVSMPSKLRFSFKNNLSNWWFNKGNQNSSFVRFHNTEQIHFTNDIDQPISLEYLYSIDRIFTSSNQSLCFNCCNLISADILFYMLIDDNVDDTSIGSVLPNVNQFIVGSSNKLDSLVLSVWILLQPNLKKLDISNLTTFDKTELAKELSDMINDYQRLKETFNYIKELIIFSSNDDIDKKTKNELFIAFQNVFINAVCR